MTENRVNPSRTSIYQVWGASAGRCTFCNRSLLANDDLGLPVPIGEIAHNVGATSFDGSPRGESELSPEERALPENLVLLCRNCHKPTDDVRHVDLLSVAEIRRRKSEFEARIAELTELAVAPPAVVLRLVGSIRGSQPELTPRTVRFATFRSGYFPKALEGRLSPEVEIDLRELDEPLTPELFAEHANKIRRVIDKLNDGLKNNDIERIAVFAFARIPLLIHMGATMSDKAEVLIFDRHRTASEDERWMWPESDYSPTFEFRRLRSGDGAGVTLLVNLSGTIDLSNLPNSITSGHEIYVIRPDTLVTPAPGVINTRKALRAFEQKFVEALAELERSHPGIGHVNLAGAIPLSAAVAIGRSLKPDVTPPLRVFDRNESDGAFFLALEVRS